MFSNVKFNARVLMATPTPVELFMKDFGDVVMHQSNSFGADPRLSALREAVPGDQMVAFVRTAQTNDPAKNVAGYQSRRQDALEKLCFVMPNRAGGCHPVQHEHAAPDQHLQDDRLHAGDCRASE